jgi:hypothetical protein
MPATKGEADAYELLEAAIAHGSRFKEWGNQAAYGNKHWFNPVYLRTQAKQIDRESRDLMGKGK